MIKTKYQCYRCEFCRKLYELKRYAESHEKGCKKNPANNRPCFYCDNAEMKEQEYWFDTYHGDDSRMVKALYCNANKTFIYPPSVERSDNGPYDFGDVSNKPMPKTCDVFDRFLENHAGKGYLLDWVPENVIGHINICEGES